MIRKLVKDIRKNPKRFFFDRNNPNSFVDTENNISYHVTRRYTSMGFETLVVTNKQNNLVIELGFFDSLAIHYIFNYLRNQRQQENLKKWSDIYK